MKPHTATIRSENGHLADANSPDRAKSVTVIIPVRNEESSIARTLEQILEQKRDGLNIEILIVDGQSTDRTREIARSFAAKHSEVRLLDNPKFVPSAARNIALQESRGDYIAIVDGHCEFPTRTHFLDLVKAFEESGADCLGRPQPLDISQATALQRAIAVARSSWLGHHPGSFIYKEQEADCPAASVAVAYRRSVFEEVGRFDERFDACEDCDFNHRIDKASLKCRFVPNLALKYHPRNSLRGLFQQLYRYGRGRVRLMRKHRDSFHVVSTMRAVLLMLLAGPIVCWAVPVLRIPYVIAIGVYLATIIGISIWQAVRKHDPRLAFWMPPAFLTIHGGAGAGIIAETITGSRVKQ
jgi:succinoglycan biosynthesis protein ExoA